jgi:hypothetical protein
MNTKEVHPHSRALEGGHAFSKAKSDFISAPLSMRSFTELYEAMLGAGMSYEARLVKELRSEVMEKTSHASSADILTGTLNFFIQSKVPPGRGAEAFTTLVDVVNLAMDKALHDMDGLGKDDPVVGEAALLSILFIDVFYKKMLDAHGLDYLPGIPRRGGQSDE